MNRLFCSLCASPDSVELLAGGQGSTRAARCIICRAAYRYVYSDCNWDLSLPTPTPERQRVLTRFGLSVRQVGQLWDCVWKNPDVPTAYGACHPGELEGLHAFVTKSKGQSAHHRRRLTYAIAHAMTALRRHRFDEAERHMQHIKEARNDLEKRFVRLNKCGQNLLRQLQNTEQRP